MKILTHIQNAGSLLKRYRWVVPLASFLWGVISGFLLTRDYNNATKLALFTFGALACTNVVALWFHWRMTTQQNIENLGKLARSLHKRSNVIEWLWFTVTQYYVQYVFLFCLPFLFLGRAWISLAITLAICITTLWDPWWEQLIKSVPYRILLRTWGGLLAASFLYAIVLPGQLRFFYYVMGILSVLLAFPWGLFFRSYRIKWTTLMPLAVFLTAWGVQYFYKSAPRFPLLSVWLKEPAFALSQEKGVFADPLSSFWDYESLEQDLRLGQSLCCVTPVVAPSVLESEVTHRWFVNGIWLEDIALPVVKGTDSQKSYRTYSCKRNFPEANSLKSLECQVLLNPNIYVGSTRISVSQVHSQPELEPTTSDQPQ